ncbi:MAG: DUF2061 domain-containing protein [Candidatus Omnitrophota bacterium]|nr:MAG: DUF2061 domain-containing protein [Candidatus Omnitrophota bacterium]
MNSEGHSRSIVKALSWRACATLATMLIVFVFTRRVVISLGVGAVEVVVKLILYYFHERIWGVVAFGRKEHPLSHLPIKSEIKKEDMEKIKAKLKELGYIDEKDAGT